VIEVPHCASIRDREREVIVLRSDNGQTWREHVTPADDTPLKDTPTNPTGDILGLYIRVRKKVKKGIAVCRQACHHRYGNSHAISHSVTCHPAEVTFPPLPQPKLVLDLATPEGCKAELTHYVYIQGDYKKSPF